MTAVSVAITKAVADQIGSLKYADSAIAAERSYVDWELELSDSGTLHIDVAAVTTEQRTELLARPAKVKFIVPVDIGVRYRFPEDQQDANGRINLDAIDGLVQLVEQIHEAFLPNRLDGFNAGVWIETKILVCPLLKHLREL